jgi:hypothetical protein
MSDDELEVAVLPPLLASVYVYIYNVMILFENQRQSYR